MTHEFQIDFGAILLVRIMATSLRVPKREGRPGRELLHAGRSFF